ncbi:putative histone-lysine N-methyltransferase 1 isoform X1 [Adelges cooleyi]|uniref:putative histone-lysine N-methyltransferase 1 isoform X1 n=1 Tax=Adelges cooleyi TaxID=133065 RepID=UPI0021807D25|nr:putative histone-lysine N-methyltransferase 1 isoform X1 [Adelges cooleyi]
MKIEDTLAALATLAQICKTSVENDAHKKKKKKKKRKSRKIVSNSLDISANNLNTISKLKRKKKKKNNNIETDDIASLIFHKTPDIVQPLIQVKEKKKERKSRETDIKVSDSLDISAINSNTISKLKRKKKKKHNIETDVFASSIFPQTRSDNNDQSLIQVKEKKRENVDDDTSIYLNDFEQPNVLKSYTKKKKTNINSVSQTSSKMNLGTSSIEKIRKSELKELEISDAEIATCNTKTEHKDKKSNKMDNDVSHLLNLMSNIGNTVSKLGNLKEEKNEDLKIKDITLAQICETSIENDAHKKKRKNRKMDIKVCNSLDISADNSNTISKLKRKKKKKHNNIKTNDIAPLIFHKTLSDIDQSLIQVNDNKRKRKNIDNDTSIYLNDSEQPDVFKSSTKKKKTNNDSVSQTSSKKKLCTSSTLIEKIRKSELKELEISDTEITTCNTKTKHKYKKGNKMDNKVSHLLNLMSNIRNTVSKLRNLKEEKNEDLKIKDITLAQICETSIENDAHKKKRKNRKMDIKVCNSLDISADNSNTISKLKRKKKKKHNEY